jgi:hypothetical protein
MDALQSMETYLSTRPSRFPSLASGIEWQYGLPLLPFTLHTFLQYTPQHTLAHYPQQNLSPCLCPIPPLPRRRRR